MRTIVKGKNFDVPDTVRAYAERKLARLERILDDRSDALVELSVEQHRSADDSHIVEVTLVIDGRTLRTHAAAVSHRAGVDEVVDKLERRAVDHREKPRHRSRPPEEKDQALRRNCHRLAYTMRGSSGSTATSAQPASSFTNSTRAQVLPPSRVR